MKTYRLLNDKEIQRQEDQYHCYDSEWLPVDISRVGTAYIESEDYPVRREIKELDSNNIRAFCGINETGACINNDCCQQCFSGRKVWTE